MNSSTTVTPDIWLEATTTVSRYALAIDERHWGAYRDLFADEVHADIRSFNGRPPAVVALDEWVAGAQSRIEALDVTQHAVTGPVVTVEDGGRMVVTAHVRAMHFFEDAWCELGGIYRHRLVRRDDRCVLSHIRLDVLWRLGDEDLFRRAYEKAGVA